MTTAQILIAGFATLGGIVFIFGLWNWAVRQCDDAQHRHEHDLSEGDCDGDYLHDIETGTKAPIRKK